MIGFVRVCAYTVCVIAGPRRAQQLKWGKDPVMKKKWIGIAFLCALFLVCGVAIPTYDAEAGPCSRTPSFCDRY